MAMNAASPATIAIAPAQSRRGTVSRLQAAASGSANSSRTVNSGSTRATPPMPRAWAAAMFPAAAMAMPASQVGRRTSHSSSRTENVLSGGD